MEQWYEKFSDMSSYNPNPKSTPDNTILSKNLSPLTNLFLNTFWNTLGRKNLIFAIPTTILPIIPLLTYMYASKTNKSIIVFTQKIGNEYLHFKNYYLLNSAGRYYLFEKVPLGIMLENEVMAEIYLPRATNRYYKSQYIKNQKERFLNQCEPKIFLYHDEANNRISNVIDKITFEEGKLDNLNVNIEIGLVIFENIDRFIYSSYTLQVFLNWISSLFGRDVNILFHFSNPLSKYIQLIKEHTNSFVLQFGPNLLRYNEELKNKSISYFQKISKLEGEEFVNKYNIDSPFFYESLTEIEILFPPLSSGNIDEYYRRGRSLLSKIDENILVNKRQYYSLINLLFKLHNLSINPSKYKELFYDPSIGYRYYTIPDLIEKIKEKINDEVTINKVYLEDLISEIYSFYLELKECKRYGENGTYSRIAKDYKILLLLLHLLNENIGNNNVIVATQSPIERNILKTEAEKLGLKKGLVIEHIGRLGRLSFERTNTILILPGPFRLKHMPELLQPYRKILMVTYNGRNYEIGKEQKVLYYTYSQQREDRSMNYLEEIYSEFGLHKDGIFKDYYDRKTEIKEGIIEEGSSYAYDDSLIVRIEKLLTSSDGRRLKDYFSEEKEVERVEQKIVKLDQEDSIRRMDEIDEYFKVSVEKIDENKIVDLNLPIDTKYFYLKTISDDVDEGDPTNFKIDYYIILLGNDPRKTLLDTIIEIFGLEDSVNRYLLTLWKKKLRNFIEKKDLSYAQCHRLYRKNGGTITYPEFLNWIKKDIYGPNSPNDYVILGKMMDDEELIENYELINQEVENLRSIHKITGRRLRKIIKEVLRGEIDQSKFSYEENMLYDQIHNNIYKIVDMERVTNKGSIHNENPSC